VTGRGMASTMETETEAPLDHELDQARQELDRVPACHIDGPGESTSRDISNIKIDECH